MRYYAAGDHDNPVKTVDFTYNKLGNITSYNDGTTSATYTYDDLQRKTEETVEYGFFSLTHSYTYYANGLKKTFTGPDGITYDYAYDSNNRLSAISIPGQGQITYNAYQWNSPIKITLPGGASSEYGYDPLMQVNTITAKDPGQNALMTRNYQYSPVGNITNKDTEHGTHAYQHDELCRLIQATNPTIDDEAYTYDAIGNRLTSADVAGTWSYNANKELQSYGNVTFEYDLNGNTTNKTNGTSETNYVYDVEDRLVRVEDGQGALIAEYYYDPFGRRLWKEVGGVRTYFFYADEGLIGEYNAGGNEIRAYGYAPDSIWSTNPLFQKVGSAYFWYQNDHLGTPQKLIASNGLVVWSGTYDSFGNCQIEVAGIENNLRFPGQYYDQEIDLHYNFNRYYDPKTGRYLRTDPFGDGINIYAYVFNNPVNGIDPLGLCKVAQVKQAAQELWTSAATVAYQLGRFGIKVTTSVLEAIHFALNSRIGIASLSALDIATNVLEIQLGLGLMAGTSFLEIGTGGIATPVSLPIFTAGATSAALGSVGLWEASNRIVGAFTNNRSMMEYDYFAEHYGQLGKTFIQAKQLADIFRKPATSFKEIIPYGIALLRQVDQKLSSLATDEE